MVDNELLTTRAHEWDVRTNNDISIDLVQKMDEVFENDKNKLFVVSQEVNHLERAMSIRFSDGIQTFMNPIFKTADRVKLCRERDLLDGKEYIVPRYSNIELIYQDTLGSVRMISVVDAGAFIIHQAMDALDGVYPGDIGLEVIPEFDLATPEEQQEVIKEYFTNILPKRFGALDEELSKDENIKDKWNALKFTIEKAKGNIKEEEKPLSNRKKKFIEKLSKQLIASKNKMKFWRKKK